MKKIGVISLGCSKNRVDTEMLLGRLVSEGHTLTKHIEEAQWLIVNTCGFIDPAKEESIDTILELSEYKKKGLCEKLIVMGCLPQLSSNDLAREIPEIDIMVGAGDIDSLISLLRKEEDCKKSIHDVYSTRVSIRGPQFSYNHIKSRILTTPFYTAYIKIAEGCSFNCSFCTIPMARGPFKSRRYESILSEAEHLADRGVVEANLIAQNTTSYGYDLPYPEKRLNNLINAVCSIKKIKWVRLLYANISHIDNSFIEMMAGQEKLCKYIDIPLQHINSTILKKMDRALTNRSDIIKRLDILRKRLPDLSLRTTFLVGFPGETEKRFKQLLEFVGKEEFDHIGVFPFSSQHATKAGKMKDSIPEEIKRERVQVLMELQKKISLKKNREKIGKVFKVLIESPVSSDKIKKNRGMIYAGRMWSQAPEVDGITYVDSYKMLKPGAMVKVAITEAMEYDLIGTARIV